MPKRNLHAQYDSWVLSVGGSFAHSGSGAFYQVTGNVHATTYYAIDSETHNYGIRLTYGGSQGTGPNPDGTYATCEIPILGVDKTDGDAHEVHATNLVDGVTSVEIDDLKIYSEEGSPGNWYVTWSEIRWIVDGVTRHTVAGGSVSGSSATPAGIPFIGVPPEFAPGAEFSPEPSLGDVPVPTTTTGTVVSVSIVTTLTGAWTVEDAYTSGPEGFPFDMHLPDAPAVECPCSAPDLPTISGTNTSAISMTAEATLQTVTTDEGTVECPCSPDPDGIPLVIRVYKAALEWITKECSLCTFPDIDREVIRFDPDNHRELVYRYGMPYTTRTGTSTCQTAFPATETGDVVTETVTAQVHPRQAQIGAPVGGAVHAMEDTLAYRCYSPASKGASKYVGASFTTVMVSPEACQSGSTSVCDVDWASLEQLCFHSKSVASINHVDEWIENTAMKAEFDHAFLLCRYANWWGSPLCSYDAQALYPPNESEDGQDNWPIDGLPIPIEYWKAKGDQWQCNPAFAEADNTLARTTQVSAHLLFDRSRWSKWGDCTFKVDDTLPDTNYTLSASNSGLFTIVDGTAVYGGSSITLTPDAGKTTIVVKIALGDWGIAPYMFAHLCNSFTVGWTPTNIDNVLVELVGEDGALVTLTDNIEGTFDRPIGVDVKYAGDWKQDYGCGFFADEGADLRPNGDSTAAMADPERVHAFSLLGGRTAKELRFTIDLTAEDDCDIDYPVFIAVTDSCYTYQLNRANICMVWPDGPGLRFGNATWYDNGTHAATPTVLPPGYPFGYPDDVPNKIQMVPSGLDWLTFKRLFLTINSYNNLLTTEIGLAWDALEATNAAELDASTLCFLVPSTDRIFPRAIITHICSVPPVCGAPRRGRGTDFVADQDWKQEVYTHAVEPRWHVANEETHVVNPADASVWTSAGSTVSSWTETHHSHAVNGEEDFFQLKRGTRAIATMRPWGGHFSVGFIAVVEGYPSLHSDIGLDKRTILVWRDGDDHVRVRIRDHNLTTIADIDTAIEADDCNVAIDRQAHPSTVLLLTVESGSVYVRVSTDGGFTFGTGTLIGTGTMPAADIGLNGIRYVYWYDSGAIKGRRYDRAGTALEAAFTAIASSDNNTFDVTVLPIAGGVNRVVIDYVVGGVLSRMTSQDGVTFA